MKMKTLFDPATLPAPEPNPMARKVGKMEGRCCKTCRFFGRLRHHDRHYFKCVKRGVTHGTGTDHRAKWHACSLYEEIREEKKS